MIVPQIYAMKRLREKTISQRHPDHTIKNNYVCIPDIENIITQYVFQYPLSNKPSEATQIINTLTKVNKTFNVIINKPHFSDSLINNFAQKLYCSHETIARLLSTHQSKQRFSLQKQLKILCYYSYTYITPDARQWNQNILNRLIAQDINLEFTYNDRDNQQKTPLMLCAIRSNAMFDLLLETNVDINTYNNHGISLLQFLTKWPIDSKRCTTIITHPKLIINQQNRHGETVLLRCLIRRKPIHVTPALITIITELLSAGADPKLADKHGTTPLMAAQKLNDERVINLIKQAIENKKST